MCWSMEVYSFEEEGLIPDRHYRFSGGWLRWLFAREVLVRY